jgi:hypothetical protein
MSEDERKEKIARKTPVISWEEFLQEHPPGNSVIVSGAITRKEFTYELPPTIELLVPTLKLYCPEKTCAKDTFFISIGEKTPTALQQGKMTMVFLTYKCRNCLNYTKTFALFITLKEDDLCEAYKFGEYPPFGPHTPARVISLIGKDRDIFLKGRRAESQGLGLGAFAYYRRVVENQKEQLIDEIIKVAKKQLGKRKDMLEKLKAAKRETQFSKAVKQIKNAIPEPLLIKGHNPFTLLHTALSRGIHAKTDKDCLKVATDIRVILVELAERIGLVLKDNAELSASLTRLLKGETQKKTKADKSQQDNSKEKPKVIEDEAE